MANYIDGGGFSDDADEPIAICLTVPDAGELAALLEAIARAIRKLEKL